MRKLQPREIRLAVITASVVLLAVSVQMVATQTRSLRELSRKELSAQVERRQQQQLLAQKPGLIEQLTAIRGRLPRHPEGEDLKSELARQVQALANQSGLRLTGQTPEPESYLEDLNLYQASVRCTWSGSSENLITFLHELNELGAVADIRDLRLRNRSGAATGLTGTFTLDFVYSRVPASELNAGIDTPPESADNTAAP